MSRRIVLLRGINLGSHNRVAMPELREVFERAGFEDVRTYLQSGNLVLSGDASPDRCRRLIADGLGLDLDVIVRTRAQLAAVVRLDPLGDVARDPKRYQVTFLATKPPRALVDRLATLATNEERFAAHGRELYAWHPNGIGRSKLATGMAGKDVAGTARNWATVTALLELASE